MSADPSSQSSSSSDDAARAERAAMRSQIAELQQFAIQTQAKGAASLSVTPRVDLPKLRAPSLYGGAMGPACDDWLSEMGQQFGYYGTKFPNDVARIGFAAAHLTGAAMHWWEQLADRHTLVAWAEFVNRLHDRFRPIQAAMFARQTVGKLRMNAGHKVNQYVSMFQSVMTPITDMGDADQVHHFVNGLLPPLAAKVWERHPKTLKEAIDLAVTVEAMRNFGHAATPFRTPFGSSYGGHGRSANTTSPMELSAVELNAFLPEHIEEDMRDSHALMQAKVESLELQLINAIGSGGGSFIPQTNHHFRGRGERIPGLTPELIAKLRKEGKCFKCKQSGHMKGECKNPAKN